MPIESYTTSPDGDIVGTQTLNPAEYSVEGHNLMALMMLIARAGDSVVLGEDEMLAADLFNRKLVATHDLDSRGWKLTLEQR